MALQKHTQRLIHGTLFYSIRFNIYILAGRNQVQFLCILHEYTQTFDKQLFQFNTLFQMQHYIDYIQRSISKRSETILLSDKKKIVAYITIWDAQRHLVFDLPFVCICIYMQEFIDLFISLFELNIHNYS